MSEPLVEDDPEVWMQFLVWGYAVTGNVCERAAAYAEGTEATVLSGQAWDHDEAWLASQRVAYGDGPYQVPPPSWALPWETERRVRAALEGEA